MPHENTRTAKTDTSPEGAANMSRQSPGEGNVVENESLAQHETAEERHARIAKVAYRNASERGFAPGGSWATGLRLSRKSLPISRLAMSPDLGSKRAHL